MARDNLTGKMIGQYRLLECIGEGGTATVYRAEHADKGICAVKILKDQLSINKTAVQRFLREAGYGNRVTHPSVVQTHDYGEAIGFFYLALEWANGMPLSKYLNKTGKVPVGTVIGVVDQIAGALAAAHEAGIIHRDLKPDNIMFDPDSGAAKLLDFGIARDAQADPAERLTRAGFFVGTLQYVAPEALSGELVSERADIYSLAKIAYHMLTGSSPHQGRSPRELFQQLLTTDPTPLNQLQKGMRFPPELERAVMKGLARDPSDRQSTVLAFAQELNEASAAGPVVQSGLLGTIRGMFSKNS